LAAAARQAPSAPASSDTADLFERKVRPLLLEKCVSCHGDSLQSGGLRLDSAAALGKGGGRGKTVVAGDAAHSLLIRAVRYEGALKMPPTGKLSDAEIADLTAWVNSGAVWPQVKPAAPATAAYVITPAQRSFWCFQPVRNSSVPVVKNRAWVKSPIDAFILAGLEKKGLTPAPPADRRTLIRRATFDLTGLPPTPEEVESFAQDKSPNAFAKVVDRLLASPRYGERWARHWLDVVRYADSADARGLGSEGDIAYAWRYRDWVVNAFNGDMPYDRFMLNQVAGDLLPAPKPGEFNTAGTIATGMLAIGNWGNGDADKDKIITDIADDQVDVVSRGFMGLTVACARCHNHKFDPIPTADYYGMAGIFFSTHILPKMTPKGAGENMLRIPLLSAEEMAKRDKYNADLAAADKQRMDARNAAIAAWVTDLKPKTASYLLAAYDYAHRNPAQAGVSLDQFATQHGLYPYALRQWTDALGMGDYRLMLQAQHDAGGVSGVSAFQSEGGTPNLLVNTNAEARTISTLTLPPRSVSVHPGASNGVAVRWTSPIAGRVRITGGVTDADPNGGDGIAWQVDHRSNGIPVAVASGEFPNGGKQNFAAGKDGTALQSIEVHPGDSLDLLVLPKADYGFDTTTVDLTIAEIGGTHVWNLRDDLIGDLLMNDKGNPHPDRYGNAAAWAFMDMAASRRAGYGGPIDPALDAFLHTAPGDRPALELAAAKAADKFAKIDASNPFWLRSHPDEDLLAADVRANLARLDATAQDLRSHPLPAIEYANGAQEGGIPESPHAGIHDVHIHIRGSYARLGDLTPRHFPIMLAGDHQPPITQGSGRLELGKWLGNPNHPTTARVMVNRIWQHHFGEGIVRTPSNFGFLGDRPSHPELLDWLAWQFMHNGWSVKKMQRTIMLSATYQQSSIGAPQTVQKDPDNRLFGHMNRFRLESESIRDNLLAVAGRLDSSMGGIATQDFNSSRRTLYVMTIRSDRSGFGPLFDVADSTASVEKRASSTVAPQALFLLNSPFVLDIAKSVARRLLQEVPSGETKRIDRAYRLLYGRPPTTDETRIGLAYLLRVRRSLQAEVAGAYLPDWDQKCWQAYAQVLLCANEFIYID
jgi:mono/diheme cytochrome c family protein